MVDEDEELFESALTDEPVSQAQPAPEAHEPEQPPRDEQGRFAPKAKEPNAPQQAQPEPKKAQDQPKPDTQPEPHGIPPWRLKEEADARRAAEERARQYEQDIAGMRRQLAQAQQQNRQPEQVPDMFEDGTGFVNHHVRANVDPIKSEMQQLREHYSQLNAVRDFGGEAVKSAYDAMDGALRSGDPEAHAVYQRARGSIDPFGDIVRWHQKTTVYNTIGSDPNAWFEKQLEERLKDPTHQAKLIERIHGNVQPNKRPPVTNLPPSLNRQTASAPMDTDGDDESDAGLLQSALRR